MTKPKAVTIDLIELVAKGLGNFNDHAVFVGGATVPFYLPSEMWAASRPTEDIDVVIELLQPGSREKFEGELRKKGFKHDITEGAPLCRWKYRNLTVDIMSPNEKVFGFSNRWYANGVKNAQKVKVDGVGVRILTVHYFLATKLEAFKDRGKNDFLGSHDMEDIITVLDGATEDSIESSLGALDAEIAKYLKVEFKKLLSTPGFSTALPGAVFDRVNATARAVKVTKRLEKICDNLV